MLVAQFGEAMRSKLRKKYEQGYWRWQDTTDPAVLESLRDKLHTHVERYQAGDPKQLVGIGNLTAMLWWHEIHCARTAE